MEEEGLGLAGVVDRGAVLVVRATAQPAAQATARPSCARWVLTAGAGAGTAGP